MTEKSKSTENPTPASLTSISRSRDTGMAMVLICLLLLLTGQRPWLIGVAITLLVVTMTRPQLFAPIAKIWFGLTHLLGSVVSFVILTLIFYVVVTPVAIIRRLKGADALQLKQWHRTTTSAFVEKEHTYVPSDLEHPY